MKRVVAAILGISLVVIGIFTIPSGESPLDEAKRAISTGDTTAGKQFLVEHLEADQHDHHSRLMLGTLLQETDPEGAMIHFKQIPIESREYVGAQKRIAQTLLVTGSDEEAIKVLKNLEQLVTDDFAVNLSLAEACFRMKRFDEAVIYANHSVRLKPERTQSYVLVAETLDELNRASEMIDVLNKAILLDDTVWEPHILLAYAASKSGNPELCERECRWCLEQRPDDSDARRMLAQSLRDQGHHQQALIEVRQAIQHAPADVRCRVLEADLLLYQRNSQGAYDTLKPLLGSNTHKVEFLTTLTRAAMMSGKRDEARNYQKMIDALARRSDDPSDLESGETPD